MDFQKAFEKKVALYEETLENAKKLLQAAKILLIPVVTTEQYPKGLGKTVKHLLPQIDFPPIPKTSFSAFGNEEFVETIRKMGRSTLIFTGIETHICVSQSALDALNYGFRSVILSDCVTSRRVEHKILALERLRQYGVEISSFEAFIYEVLEKADTPQFKAMLPLLKWR